MTVGKEINMIPYKPRNPEKAATQVCVCVSAGDIVVTPVV